jgi:hypothetical protein
VAQVSSTEWLVSGVISDYAVSSARWLPPSVQLCSSQGSYGVLGQVFVINELPFEVFSSCYSPNHFLAKDRITRRLDAMKERYGIAGTAR